MRTSHLKPFTKRTINLWLRICHNFQPLTRCKMKWSDVATSRTFCATATMQQGQVLTELTPLFSLPNGGPLFGIGKWWMLGSVRGWGIPPKLNPGSGVQRGKLWPWCANGRTAWGTSGNGGLRRELHVELHVPVERLAVGFSVAPSERFKRFSIEKELPARAGEDVVAPSDAILTLQQGV